MKKRKGKILLTIFGLSSPMIVLAPILTSCSSTRTFYISNDNIDNLISLINDNVNDLNVWDENFSLELKEKIKEFWLNLGIEVKNIEFILNDSYSTNYKYFNIVINLGNDNYILDENVHNANIDNKNLEIQYNFQTMIWNDNLEYKITNEDLEKIYQKIQELYLINYTNDDVDPAIGTNNSIDIIVKSINDILSKNKNYPLVIDINQPEKYDIFPKNGHKCIQVELVFPTKRLAIDESQYFEAKENKLITKIPVETSVNSIKKDKLGRWDLTFIYPALKEIITETGSKIDNRDNIDDLFLSTKEKIQSIFSPYLSVNLVSVKDNKFNLGSDGKQEFTFAIDFGNKPIIITDSYKENGFSYFNNRYLCLENVKSNINNLEINEENVFNVTTLLDYFYEIISEELIKIEDINNINDALNLIIEKLNNFLGNEYIIGLQIIPESQEINSKTSKLDYKLKIIFDAKYQLILDSKYQGDYSCSNNILNTGIYPTSIDANYNNIKNNIIENFSTLTIEDIKNDVYNHAIDQLNFLKINIDYIQTLLQNIVSNQPIYSFMVDNAEIIANLINNIITQSIRKDLQATEFFKAILMDSTLKEILNNTNAIDGLIRLIENFMPSEADSITQIINTLKSLPINMIITTLQKILSGKLPDNIIQSLDDLKQLGVISFIIERDVDLLSLLPTNNVLNKIIEILKLTTVENFKQIGIIDFIIQIIKTNNGKNLLKELLVEIMNGNTNSPLIKILDSFVINNSHLNRDTLIGVFNVFANPINASGSPVKYKDFLNSISVSHWYNQANYSSVDNRLDLNFEIKFQYNSDLYFDIRRILDILPDFSLRQFLIDYVPRKIGIIKGDYIKYTLKINDTVKYNIDQQLNKYCLSWQAMAAEQYDINMKRSCEKWYRETPGKLPAVAKIFSKYMTGLFYRIWDVDLNFKPDNSVLNKYVLPGYVYNSKYNGSVRKININESEKNQIKNDILSTTRDNWVKNTEYTYGAGIEWVQISQFNTTYNYNVENVINKFVDLSNYNDEYYVRLDVHTIFKQYKITGIVTLPVVRLVQIKIFFPHPVDDGNGNFVKNMIFTL